MSHLHKRLQLFKNPSFSWYFLSAFIAMFGVGLNYISMSWMVLKYHNSISSIMILILAFWMPNIIFSPFSGVLADRLSRKWLIFSANFSRAILLIIFGFVIMQTHHIALLYYLSLLQGLMFSVFLPAVMSFIREIVEPEDLLYANSTIDMGYELGNIIGMGSAGLLIALFNAPATLIINGVLFMISCALVVKVKKRVSLKSDVTIKIKIHFIADFKEGLRYLLSNKNLFIIYIVQLLLFVEYLTAPILLAPFAKNVLHASVGQFGAIEMVLSVGAVIGGILVPWLVERYGFMRSMTMLMLTLSFMYLLFGYNRNILLAGVLYFIIGICFASWPVLTTRGQKMTDLAFQGRVHSCFNSLSGIAVIGVYSLISISDRYISVGFLYWIMFGVSLLGVALLLGYSHVNRKSRALYVNDEDLNVVV